MSKVLETSYPNNLTFRAKCLVEIEEYNDFKKRIETQLLKNVEVPGFRKGFVPEDVARKKIDLKKLETTVFEETIQKFLPELSKQVEEQIKEAKRVVDKVSLSPGEKVEETAEGLVFSLDYGLFSNVDIEAIKKIPVDKPNPEQIEGYETLESFSQREKTKLIAVYNQYELTDGGVVMPNSQVVLDITETPKNQPENAKINKGIKFILGINQFPKNFEEKIIGLKAGDKKQFELDLTSRTGQTAIYSFDVEIKSVSKPVFSTLQDVFEKSDEAKKNFKTVDDFKSLIQKTWETQTQKLVDESLRKEIVAKLIQDSPEIEIDQQRLENQTNRIYENIQKKSLASNKSALEVYKQAGLPYSDNVEEKGIRSAIEAYVASELKLLAILEFIFFTQANRSKTEDLLNKIKKEVKVNPTAYGLEEYIHESKDGSKHKHPTNQEIETTAYDILVRQVAYTWLLSNIESLNPTTPTE
jgi:trigger factor